MTISSTPQCFKQSDGTVGERLDRAARPGRVAQGQEQIGGDALGPGVGLQGDLQDRLAGGRLGLFRRVEPAVMVDHTGLPDAGGPKQRPADRLAGLPAGLVAVLQEGHRLAEPRVENDEAAGHRRSAAARASWPNRAGRRWVWNPIAMQSWQYLYIRGLREK